MGLWRGRSGVRLNGDQGIRGLKTTPWSLLDHRNVINKHFCGAQHAPHWQPVLCAAVQPAQAQFDLWVVAQLGQAHAAPCDEQEPHAQPAECAAVTAAVAVAQHAQPGWCAVQLTHDGQPRRCERVRFTVAQPWPGCVDEDDGQYGHEGGTRDINTSSLEPSQAAAAAARRRRRFCHLAVRAMQEGASRCNTLFEIAIGRGDQRGRALHPASRNQNKPE